MLVELIPGVNFTNVLLAVFVSADNKNAKIHLWLDYLFALLGSLLAKAACKIVVKSVLGETYWDSKDNWTTNLNGSSLYWEKISPFSIIHNIYLRPRSNDFRCAGKNLFVDGERLPTMIKSSNANKISNMKKVRIRNKFECEKNRLQNKFDSEKMLHYKNV